MTIEAKDSQPLFSNLFQALVNLEKNYRIIMQGFRTFLTISIAVLLYYFMQRDQFIWVGVCCLGLTQTCVRSPYWPFEINMVIAYLLVVVLTILAYPFSHSPLLSAIYSFFLVFLIYIFSYFKLNSTYFMWTYFIAQFSLLQVKSFSDTITDVFMSSIAFLICMFICAIVVRPKLKTECLYEMRSTLRSLSNYLMANKKYSIDRSEKSVRQFKTHRSEVVLHVKNLRMMGKEIEYFSNKEGSKGVKYFDFYILFFLYDLFVEILIQISILLRYSHCQVHFNPQVIRLYKVMKYMSVHFIDFLSDKDNINLDNISLLLDQFSTDAELEYLSINNISDILSPEHYREILFIAKQFKEEIDILKLEFNRLLEKKTNHVFK